MINLTIYLPSSLAHRYDFSHPLRLPPSSPPVTLPEVLCSLLLNGETFEVVVSEPAALFSLCLLPSHSLRLSHCRGRLWFMYCLWRPPLISCNTAFISVPGPAIASIFSPSDCLTSCSFSGCPLWLYLRASPSPVWSSRCLPPPSHLRPSVLHRRRGQDMVVLTVTFIIHYNHYQNHNYHRCL